MPHKCILLILDGLGDRAYPELGHKTPLQVARTSNLDKLAALGSNGLFHAERYGMALPSENAHFSMFGYETKNFPGRGYLEALGAEINVGSRDVAILAHFVNIREEDNFLILQKDRPPASSLEIAELVRTIEPFSYHNLVISYSPTKGLDGIILIKGEGSPFVTDSDPLLEGHPVISCEPLTAKRDDNAAISTSRALNKFLIHCHKTLKDHPVNQKRKALGKPAINAILFQRPGVSKAVQPFISRWGLKGLSISSGIIYWGLCKFIGMDILKAEDKDDPGTDLCKRLELSLMKLDEYDFIHVHTKAPDVAAHTKDPLAKMKTIESLDLGIGCIMEKLTKNQDIILVITSDHSTPSSGPLIHSGEPVPITIVGKKIRRDRVSNFDEINCSMGCLGCLSGRDLMPVILNCLDRAKLKGLMDTPIDQPYWPGIRKPFRIES